MLPGLRRNLALTPGFPFSSQKYRYTNQLFYIDYRYVQKYKNCAFIYLNEKTVIRQWGLFPALDRLISLIIAIKFDQTLVVCHVIPSSVKVTFQVVSKFIAYTAVIYFYLVKIKLWIPLSHTSSLDIYKILLFHLFYTKIVCILYIHKSGLH